MFTGHKSQLTAALIVGSLGVVYGDIGTSPLYALKEVFFGHFHLARNLPNVLGALSLIFWALMIVVTIKYIFYIMRADNHGDGGILALLALIRQGKIKRTIQISVAFLIIIGASLLYGDGVITPAISVLSAVEGLSVITANFDKFIIPITVAILAGLFIIQKNGSGVVGKFFGPVMILWFLVLIALGLPQIIHNPVVLNAINPMWAMNFFILNRWVGFLVLGAVVLCVTGVEALYADMSHFGKRAITTAWVGLVYPALAINYFGQGAKLLTNDVILNNHLFYSLAPSSLIIPLVILSTCATVIASQALISGAFSLTHQAIALGLFPRLKIVHTNPTMGGQIYLPFVNWFLFFGCAALVIFFKTSGALAAAYGIAVTGTMTITTIAFYVLARYQWKWSLYLIGPLILFFLVIDLAFLSANLLKFFQGGFISIAIAFFIFTIIRVWEWGRGKVTEVHKASPGMSVDELIEKHFSGECHLVNRSVVALSARPVTSVDEKIPTALNSFYERWGDLGIKHIIFFTVVYLDQPYVSKDDRYVVTTFHTSEKCGTILSIQAFYGYMQTPNIRALLIDLKEKGIIKIPANPKKWLVLATNERFVSKERGVLNKIRMALFKIVSKLSKPSVDYLGFGNDPQVSLETLNI